MLMVFYKLAAHPTLYLVICFATIIVSLRVPVEFHGSSC